MISEIEENNADLVVASRYSAGGSFGGWEESRKKMSRMATMASQVIFKHNVSDPMSGFFMLNRQALDTVVHNLSGLGFKILLDILVTGKNHLRVSEVPYRFRGRHTGESKLDGRAAWEYGMLLADKTVGRFIPVRFLAFSIIGGLGVFVHMGVLALVLKILGLSFLAGQSIATGTAMVFNFTLNNILTYRDRRLTGWAWLTGLLSFMIACSIGALANIGIANFLFQNRTQWVIAAIAGILVSVVWNYAITKLYTWRKKA
jgi:dolichol-phosphate mannosyltransferase